MNNRGGKLLASIACVVLAAGLFSGLAMADEPVVGSANQLNAHSSAAGVPIAPDGGNSGIVVGGLEALDVDSSRMVRFDSSGGPDVEAQKVEDGDKATEPPMQAPEGWTFIGWMLDGKPYDFNTPVIESITLKAMWNKPLYIWEDDSTDSVFITSDQNDSAPAGYSLLRETPSFVPSYSDRPIYRLCKTELDQGADQPESPDGESSHAEDDMVTEYRYVSDADELASLTANGWALDGDGAAFYSADGSAEGSYPVYCIVSPYSRKCHYTWDANERDALASKGWTQGGVSWYGTQAPEAIQSTDYMRTSIVGAEVVLDEAEYVAKDDKSSDSSDASDCAVKLFSNGEEVDADFRVSYNYDEINGTVAITVVGRGDYCGVINRALVLSRDMDIWTVAFDSAGGSAVDSQEVENGMMAEKPLSPTRAGCKFSGWMLDDNPYDFGAAVTQDITLQATWEEGAEVSYTVSDVSWAKQAAAQLGGSDLRFDCKPIENDGLIDYPDVFTVWRQADEEGALAVKCFDVTLSVIDGGDNSRGQLSEGLKIAVHVVVGAEYNGKPVVVTQVHDKGGETKIINHPLKVVNNGIVTVDVTQLSGLVVAVYEEGYQPKPQDTTPSDGGSGANTPGDNPGDGGSTSGGGSAGGGASTGGDTGGSGKSSGDGKTGDDDETSDNDQASGGNKDAGNGGQAPGGANASKAGQGSDGKPASDGSKGPDENQASEGAGDSEDDRASEGGDGSENGQANEGGQDSGADGQPAASNPQEMYRLYDPWSGEHFYTASESERDDVANAGWTYEGVGWKAPTMSNTPVYRLYNQFAGEHHYTMDEAEKNGLVEIGWTYEGVGWYSDDAQTTPLMREYNPFEFANNHNYTTDVEEHSYLVSLGWRDEGYAWFGM